MKNGSNHDLSNMYILYILHIRGYNKANITRSFSPVKIISGKKNASNDGRGNHQG